ncbi:hypothetical protein [Salinivibrio socompensis]|nr:hypothetical protein [Salinivibrio socompensis]
MSLHLVSTHGDEPINWYALVSDYDGMHQEVYGLLLVTILNHFIYRRRYQ